MPVEDYGPYSEAVRRQFEGTHTLDTLPGGQSWEIRIQHVLVLPQPLGTVLAQALSDSGELADAELLGARVGVLDVGFRTTDYFTMQAMQIVPSQC